MTKKQRQQITKIFAIIAILGLIVSSFASSLLALF